MHPGVVDAAIETFIRRGDAERFVRH